MLVVHPDHQGRGAGRALLRVCTDTADLMGLPTFLFGSPRGKRLYENVGFAVEKEMLNDKGVVITSAMKRMPVLPSLHNS
jgi:GNAT superfamily N-acetyltransferase